jgi:16S rRNA (guanine527-N7)-methyltransferase
LALVYPTNLFIHFFDYERFKTDRKILSQLTEKQKAQFAQLGELYREWNERINVVSRQDIENIYEKHILHSLGIAKVVNFKDFSEILDVGTGGGFPGIPLAIMFHIASFI